MNFELRAGSLAGVEADAILVAAGPDGALPEPETAVDERLDGAIRQALADAGFSGDVGKTLVIPTLGMLAAKRLVVTGIGPEGTRTPASIRRAWGLAARAARDAGARSLASAPPPTGGSAALQAAVEGVQLSTYQFLEYRTSTDANRELETVTFLTDANEAQQAVKTGDRIASGVGLARDLGNYPPDSLYPARLADIASEMAKELGVECRVYDRAALEEMGAGAILAVGKGSEREPRLIHLIWRPEGESTGSVALVGKAITFDTGGINLKPSGSIETMKIDMAGGAAVLGAMSVVPSLGLPFTVHGVIASAENMMSGSAFRPSDILRTMNGKTIEIGNTDAEGRLVLADALTYAAREGAEAMIDLATLTGASVVALGNQGTSLFGSDQKLVDEILAAASTNGELMWQMPMWDEYQDLIKGDVADLKNSGARTGGAIFGALFLREFTEGIPWAHLDIAGPAWSDSVHDLGPKGATGYGVRTLLTFLQNRTHA